jgi:uncharacterized protein
VTGAGSEAVTLEIVGRELPELRPAQQKERIDVLDALRGFAVFGMFIINIRVFSGYTYFFHETSGDLFLSGWDTTFDRIHIVLFSGKFYTLFALLFGIGFAIQIMKASAADRSFIAHFSRRLFFLLLIGIVHLWGIWFSDILVFYAICGYLLLLFRSLSGKGLLWAVILLLFIPGLHSWYLIETSGGYTNTLYRWLGESWTVMGLPAQSGPDGSFRMENIADVIRSDSWETVFRFNFIGPLLRFYLIAYDARIIKILAMFVLGFWIGRNILDNQIHKKRAFLAKVAIAGFLLGLPLNIFYSMDNGGLFNDTLDDIISNSLNTFGYITLTSAYAATFALLYTTGFRKFLDWSFNAVGKSALSNYLFQSVAGILLFYSAGLGLGEYFGATALTISVLAIFGFQILFSRLWLGNFRFGPVEWLWRSLTYGRFINNAGM